MQITRFPRNVLQLCRNPRRVFWVRGHRYLYARDKRYDMPTGGLVTPPRLEQLHWLFYVGSTRAPRVLYRRRN